MQVQLESTTKLIEVGTGYGGSTYARVWEGITETGIEVHAFIVRIAVHKGEDQSKFYEELQQCRAPFNADILAYPTRMIL